MSKRKIISVGFELPGDIEYVPINSDRSLMDADIIIFTPYIPSSYYDWSEKEFKGNHVLNNKGSFAILEDVARWKSELKSAIEIGKTILFFMKKPDEVYVRKVSGRLVSYDSVSYFSSYNFIPFIFESVVPRSGGDIVPASDLKFLSLYWKNFARNSKYEVYLEGNFSQIHLSTKSGNKILGASVQETGLQIFLPPLYYDEDAFIDGETADGEGKWTDEATSFGNKLVASLVAIDKVARGDREASLVPSWGQELQYRLKAESVIEQKINHINIKLDILQTEKLELTSQLEMEGSLRRLLYEGGHQLEVAIIETLQLIGFHAENYQDSNSEFDIIFTSAEGRFLGEAEGKDRYAISIDKLRQLEMNIQEDFAREEVTEYAKGVLFGNAHRLSPPQERSEFFTEKVLSGAKRTKIALVKTTDLFVIAKYLKENEDEDFARKCRLAFKETEGEVIVFPPIPAKEYDEA